MKKYRIGKDIPINWAILVDGKAADLSQLDLKLFLHHDRVGAKRELDFTTSGSTLRTTVSGTSQHHTGTYRLTLWLNYGKAGQSVLDNSRAFALVESTEMEGGEDDNNITTDPLELEGVLTTSASHSGFVRLGRHDKRLIVHRAIAEFPTPGDRYYFSDGIIKQRIGKLQGDFFQEPYQLSGDWYLSGSNVSEIGLRETRASQPGYLGGSVLMFDTGLNSGIVVTIPEYRNTDIGVPAAVDNKGMVLKWCPPDRMTVSRLVAYDPSNRKHPCNDTQSCRSPYFSLLKDRVICVKRDSLLGLTKEEVCEMNLVGSRNPPKGKRQSERNMFLLKSRQSVRPSAARLLESGAIRSSDTPLADRPKRVSAFRKTSDKEIQKYGDNIPSTKLNGVVRVWPVCRKGIRFFKSVFFETLLFPKNWKESSRTRTADCLPFVQKYPHGTYKNNYGTKKTALKLRSTSNISEG